jgi:ribosome-associated protein
MKTISKDLQEKSSLEIAKMLANAALEKKAEDLKILNVKTISSFTDYFVIMSGRSTRHVKGLAEAVDAELRKKNRIKASNTEGLNEGQWVLLDYNDVVVHIFYRETRKFYDLENLWHDAEKIPVNNET